MAYLITICLMLLVYAAAICGMGHLKNTRWCNRLFALLVVVPYALLVAVLYAKGGCGDWNFLNAMPTANVSPFMFTLVPVVMLSWGRLQARLHLLIALLSVGMLCSPLLSCVSYFAIQYRFHFHFLLDFIAHVALSLWGVYLIKSGQVRLTLRDALASAGVILGAAACMLVLNLVFDTAFFGLSLSGKHNIYNMVLVSNGALSAGIYFLGLCLVMVLGAGFQALLNRPHSDLSANEGCL